MDSLHEIFSRTEARLREAGIDDLLSLFLRQNLDCHFFPPFLRSKKTVSSICELAQLEWIHYEIRQNFAESGEGAHLASVIPVACSDRVRLNPLARWIALNHKVSEFGLPAGLWLVGFEDQQIKYHRLQREHALVLDLLTEGLNLSASELQRLAEEEAELSCGLAIEDLRRWKVLQSDRQ